MERVICLCVGYLFGLIQTGYIMGKINGIDIRKKGSGNSGATNAVRTMGWAKGIFTMCMDILKCIVAVAIMRFVYRDSAILPLLSLYTAAGVVLGHDFPFYLKFKGGKGISATGGMIIAFGDIRLILIGIVCFFLPIIITHMVSVGSLLLSVSFFIGLIVSGQMGVYGMPGNILTEMYIVTGFLTALAIFLHRGNIKRLIQGKERKLF